MRMVKRPSGFSYKLTCLFISLFVISGSFANLCEDITTENVERAISRKSTPLLGKNAGKFQKVEGVTEFVDCVVSCCEHDTCNVAFVHQRSCYMIECNASLPHGCDPKVRRENKYRDTIMVTVRPLDETAGVVLPAMTTSATETTSSFTEAVPHRPDNMACVEGLDECTPYDYEECVVQRYDSTDHEESFDRRRHGLCHCIKGYRRNSVTKFCEEIPESTSILQNHSTIQTTESQGTVTTMITQVTTNETKVNTKPESTVPETTTIKTTTIKSTTTEKTLIPLTVSAGGNKVLQLPGQNSVTLLALAVPKEEEGKTYDYHWSLTSHPTAEGIGEMTGTNTAELKLTHLIAGLYSFKVTVSSDDKYGEAFVNVTVKPPLRQNQPPQAIIKPTNQEVKEGNTVVLDGSESKDDDKIVSHEWEMISGPLTQKEIHGNQPMLQLQDLTPGAYLFKLTVTDSDGVSKSTTANVTVQKEVDYPPRANAGSDVILTLPENSVDLNGNQSTDDKGIATYEWVKKTDDKLTADMTGVRSKLLHLSNLQEGDYTFTLKVTDSGGQTNTADVHVFVKPESTKPPQANAGEDVKIALPDTTATLDGTASTETDKIIKYTWKQTSGEKATLDNADRAVATVSDLKLGTYEFSLTVSNAQNQETTDSVTLTVEEDKNQAPVARAGEDLVVTLPVTMLAVDGSGSSDDKAIVSYEWTRDDRSLAAGDIINGSDHQAVLQLTNLVAGRYIFTLKVADEEGVTSTDTANIKIEEDSNAANLVELYLETNVDSFSEGNKKNLENQLALLLYRTSSSGETKVKIQKIVTDMKTGQLGIVFLVEEVTKELTVVRPGNEIVSLLKKKMNSGTGLLEYKVTYVDTVVCLNNCSSHGHCDKYSKICVCEAFWMENVFKARFMNKESNCDWSILYVIIVIFIIVIGTAVFIWAIVCAIRRYRARRKKRHRYSLLEDEDDREKKEKIELLPRGKNGKKQLSSLMLSESEFSSADETIFLNGKKNGISKPSNGLRPGIKAKIKA